MSDLDFYHVSNPETNIQPKPWMKGKTLELCKGVEHLREIVDKCLAVKAYGIDVEATGLDTRVLDAAHGTVDKIVGLCLAPSVTEGYYIPIRHHQGVEHNIPMTEVIKEIQRLNEGDAMGVFFNAAYDHEMLEFSEGEPLGTWDAKAKFEDVMLMVWLEDSRRKKINLKDITKEILDWEMIELEELFPPEHPKDQLDFSLLDPSEYGPTLYGASDAICTLALFEHYKPLIYESPTKGVRSQRGIYQIEKMCVAAKRWMERSRIPLDMDKVAELIRSGQDDMVHAFEVLYKEVNKALAEKRAENEGRVKRGDEMVVDVRPAWIRLLVEEYPKIREEIRIDKKTIEKYRSKARMLPLDQADPTSKDGKNAKFKKGGEDFQVIYDVMSPAQLGLMLHELGVKMPKTETGQISTKKELLDEVIEKEGDDFEWMAQIKKFREVNKALGSFLLPMENDAAPDGTIKVTFKQRGTDTGRFATPGEKDKGSGLHGGTSMNLHSLPSKDKQGKVECMRRIRECVRAREGKILVAIDYSGVELRMVTNVSQEPKFIKAFFECSTCGRSYPREATDGLPPKTPAYCYGCGDDRIGDLHTISGMAFYGDDAPNRDNWKELRGHAKNTNFALLYGGTGNTVSTRIGCDKNEGWRIFKQFNSTYPDLKKWQEAQVKFARKYGFVITAFGRRYPTPDINNEIKWIKEKNERNAINGPIQGSSADTTKLAMALAYSIVKKRGWFGKVNMLITIHDELVFEIDRDIFEEAVEVIEDAMTANPIIAGLKWPVPLTSDVEFGENWAVPYDRKDWIFQREALHEHEYKGKKVPGWPQWALDLFTERSIDPVIREKMGKAPAEKVQAGDSHEESSAPAPSRPVNGVSKSVADPRVPDMKMGDVFEYHLQKPLTFGCIEALAQVVTKSINRGGTRLLRVYTKDGKVLLDESSGIKVDVSNFRAFAEDRLE